MGRKQAHFFRLSAEIIQHIFSFLDLQSMHQVRAVCSTFLNNVNKPLAERLCMSWNVCISKNLSPIEMIRYHPSQYIASLVVPLTHCQFALKLIESFNLKVHYIQSFLRLHSDKDVDIPYGFFYSKRSIATLLDDKSVFIIPQDYKGPLDSFKVLRVGNIRTLLGRGGCLFGLTENRGLSLLEPSLPSLPKITVSGRFYTNKLSSFFITDSGKLVTTDDMYSKKNEGRFVMDIRKSVIAKKLRHYSIPPNIPSGRKVMCVVCASYHTAIVLDDGQILFWGIHENQIESPILSKDRKATSLYSNDNSFVATLDNHTLVHWGELVDSNENNYIVAYRNQTLLSERMENVSAFYQNYRLKKKVIDIPIGEQIYRIFSNRYAYVGLLQSGSLFSWGDVKFGANLPKVPDGRRVKTIFNTYAAFVALLDNGEAICWGDPDFGGGRIPKIPEGCVIETIFSNHSSFVALLNNRRLHAWGNPSYGGKTPDIPVGRVVKSVFANELGYVAVLDNDQILSWGDCLIRYFPNPIRQKRVKNIFPLNTAFVAQIENNEFVVWGWTGNPFQHLSYAFVKWFKLPEKRVLATMECQRSKK